MKITLPRLVSLALLACGIANAQPTPAGGPAAATPTETAAGTITNKYISPYTLSGSSYAIPSQTGNNGKFLTTNGTTASWGTVNLSAYLPLAGGTMTGAILFTDNLYDIGASGATRPRSIYVGTSFIVPGGGTITGASGVVTVTPTSTNPFYVQGASTDSILTIKPAGSGANNGWLKFEDGGGVKGSLKYRFAAGDIMMNVNGVDALLFQQAQLTPAANGATSLGASSLQFANGFFSTLLTLSSTSGTSAGGILLRDVPIFSDAAGSVSITPGILKLGVGATTSALTDLLINPTTKASGLLFSAAVNGSSKMSVDYAGALTTAGGIVGTTTNDAATAGNVGQLLSAQLAAASTTSLTSTTAKTIVSLALTAGDWEVTGVVHFIPANTAVVGSLVAGISATTDTQASSDSVGGYGSIGAVYTSGGAIMSCPLTPIRISLAGTTTYYLVATATFSVSTCTGFGTIRARRLR